MARSFLETRACLRGVCLGGSGCLLHSIVFLVMEMSVRNLDGVEESHLVRVEVMMV